MNEQEINTCSFCRAKRPVMRQYLHAKNKPVVGNGSDFIYYCNECGIMEQVINQPTMTKADWLRSEIEKMEEGIEIPDTIQMDAEEYWDGHNSALTSIITRYKEELLELEKVV